MAVGVFDSGLGGLTVLDAVQKRLPHVPFVYLGDNAHAPYGVRDADDIFRLTCEGVERLWQEGCDLVVLACNTASANAAEHLRAAHPDLPIFGVVDPAVRAATLARLVALYHVGVDPAHHRLKLDVAGGPPLPPTLIQAGSAEMLEADARQLAAEIRTAGGSCELQVWPDQMHVFQSLPRLSPEAPKAMAYAAQFIAAALQAPAAERMS